MKHPLIQPRNEGTYTVSKTLSKDVIEQFSKLQNWEHYTLVKINSNLMELGEW